MGGLFFGAGLTASAGSTSVGLLPGIVSAVKSNALKSVKAQADALYRMARNELRAGDHEKAVALLQQVLTLNPQHKKAREELESLNKAGVSLEPQASLISSDNLSAQEMMNVADAMLKDGDYAGAESLLLKAQKKAETDAERKRVEAYLSAISKEREKAAKVKQEVVDYNNTQLDSQIQKGIIYLENNQYDKAEVELQRAKLIAPDDKRVDQLLSQVYAKRGQAQKGEAIQQQAAMTQDLKEQAGSADMLFREGVVLYKEGRIIEAVDKWNQALQVYPDHAMAQTYLANTENEYQKALKDREAAVELAAEEAAFEQKLDQPIMQYSTEGESLDIKNVLSTLSKISGLNIVMGENLAGNVAFEVKNTTVREVLNLLQKQYGFVWSREKGTIFVEQGFKTKIFSLTEGQYKTIEMILSDPSVLEDSSKNLRTILYGPGDEFNVPGKQLYLNRTSQSLLVTDTETNIRRVEAFLKEMPELIQEKKPVETRTYRLDKDIAKEIFEIVKLVLYKGQGGYDLTNPNRALYLEPNSSVLIVIDYPENIEEVEKILSQNQITQQLEEGTLEAKQFSITDMDDVETTPEALLRREEFVTAISDILVQMLYGREGRDAAKLQGRMIVPNPDRGTIDVVDTRENIRRVENYLNSV
ncbi:MAG: tetratricopeptide repeat protein, partial [Candidatus Hinthialibacter sp.]